MAKVVDDYAKVTNVTMTFIDHIKKNWHVYLIVLAIALIIASCCVTIHVALKTMDKVDNPIELFEKMEQYEEKKHAMSFEKRMESTPQVQSMLETMQLDFNANRCFVIEMHNGKYNSAGLSFNYGEIGYEVSTFDDCYIMDMIEDFQLNKYPFFSEVYSQGYWSGSVNELEQIDKKFALIMKANEVNYLTITTIYGTKCEIGFLAVGYVDKPDDISNKDMLTKINKYASRISPLLDGKITS